MSHFNESITPATLESLDSRVWQCETPDTKNETLAGLTFDSREILCRAKPYGDGFELVVRHATFETGGQMAYFSVPDTDVMMAREKMHTSPPNSGVGIHPMEGWNDWPQPGGVRNVAYGMLLGLSTYSHTTALWKDINYYDFNLSGRLDHGDMISINVYTYVDQYSCACREKRPIDRQELINLNGRWVDWQTGRPMKPEHQSAVDLVRVNYSAMWRAAGLSKKPSR